MISHFQKKFIHNSKYRIQITLLERTCWHTTYATQAFYESAVLSDEHIYLRLHHKYTHMEMQLLKKLQKKKYLHYLPINPKDEKYLNHSAT
jgi:hypothetical protein